MSFPRCLPLLFVFLVFVSSSHSQDQWEWRSPTPTGSRMVSYAFGQGLFVGVGQSGTIVTSPDGTNWTLRETGTLTDLKKVVFTGTRFVAVGGMSVLTSDDGKTWSLSTAPANFLDLAYGQGRYVAIAERTTESGANKFVISTDASSWTVQDAPPSFNPQKVVFAKDLFVVGGDLGDVLTSKDALNWDHVTIGGMNGGSPYLVASSTRFLITWRGPVYSSDDGSAWKQIPNGPVLNYNGVLGYAGGKFFVDQGRHTRGVGFSSDGLVWSYPDGTTDEYSPYYIDFSTVAFGASTYVATEVTYFYGVANSKSYSIHASADGRTWSAGSSTLFPIDQFSDNPIVYGIGRYFFEGRSSSDGLTWVETGVRPTHAAGARVFRLPAESESSIEVSADGLSSTKVDTAISSPRSVAFGANRYVIVGDGGEISTSSDAQRWSTTTSPTTADLYDVIYAFNRFIAVGSAGTLLTSTDGLTWARGLPSASATEIFRRVVAGSDRLLVLGTKISASDSPIKLSDGTAVEFAPYDDAVFFNGSFLACARVYYDENQPYVWIPHLWKSADAKSWTEVLLHVGYSAYSNSIPALATGNGSALFASKPGSPSSSAVYAALLQTSAPGSRSPTIVSAPKNQTAARGETVMFTVGANGSGALRYQWSHAGEPIAGATQAVLKLDLINDASAGKYTVTVTNSAGSVTSESAELTVTAPTPLTITQEPTGGPLFELKPFVLSVAAAGSGPISYQWRRNGQPIFGATTASYTIYTLASSRDSAVGNYDVVLTAPYSTATSRTVAVKWGGPEVSMDLSGVVFRKVGESVRVVATVSGAGPFTYRWSRPGPEGTIAGANSAILELTNLTPSDSGPISLIVTDAAGNTFSFSAINLTVSSDYQLGYTSSRIAVSLGQAFTLGSGPFVGSSSSSYQWYHNGTAIPGANQSAVTFTNFSEADVGDYTLVYVAYPGATPTITPPATLTLEFARLTNLSARGFAGTGEDTLIEGFVLRGDADGDLLVRSIGPELAKFGVTNAVADPSLRVLDAKHVLVAENDDWSIPRLNVHSIAVSSAATAAVGAFPLSPGSKDSAVLIHQAPPGLYTTQVSNETGKTGLVMNEIYAPPSARQRLVNLSARARVSNGDNILIGGFVIAGTRPFKVLIRGVGPTLAGQGISAPLNNPKLTLFKNTAAIQQNDNWGEAPNLNELRAATVATGAFPLNEGSTDAAMLVSLDPGVYSVHVTSVDGSNGVALVEIYEAP